MTVIKLATSQQNIPVRACSTCRHREGGYCGATGSSLTWERGYEISTCKPIGKFWEPKPPPKEWAGLFPVIRKFFWGT